MIHNFSDRITRYNWLDGPGLPEFYWATQSVYIRSTIIQWLDAWYRRLFLKEERPPTILSLWGANGSGKSSVARGIARFHLFNLSCASFELIPWAAFVDDQLNGQVMHPNWEAHLLLLDDLDSRRPVPESKSTWLLDKLSGRLKYRAEILHYPTILTSNRNPINMTEFLTTSATGQTDAHVEQSATTLISALERHLFATLEFKFSHELRAKCNSDREFYRRLRESAEKHNNMRELGFHFLEEKYDEETWWTWRRE